MVCGITNSTTVLTPKAYHRTTNCVKRFLDKLSIKHNNGLRRETEAISFSYTQTTYYITRPDRTVHKPETTHKQPAIQKSNRIVAHVLMYACKTSSIAPNKQQTLKPRHRKYYHRKLTDSRPKQKLNRGVPTQ